MVPTKLFSAAAALGLSACSLLGQTTENSAPPAPGAAPEAVPGAGSVTGARTCATSGCHGGADEQSNQYALWLTQDVHSGTTVTLSSARAARMADALGIANPAASARCTVCHAPLAAMPAALLGSDAEVSEGVSCVSCHGLPEGWLRGHTRPDWTHAQRVAAGMRDLNDLYTRANTCIACHQNLDPELVRTGRHPVLIFELDGQTQSEPKHWHEARADMGAQAWYVGQAVALREISWALLNGQAPEGSRERWTALVWLLRRTGLGFEGAALASSPASGEPRAADYAAAVEQADLLARRASLSWKPDYAREALRRLAAVRADFLDSAVAHQVQACRADRLVLALDRLVADLPPEQRPAASSRLDPLFRLVQSQPDFAPADFARALDAFSAAL